MGSNYYPNGSAGESLGSKSAWEKILGQKKLKCLGEDFGVEAVFQIGYRLSRRFWRSKTLNFKGKIKKTDSNYTLSLNEVGQGVDVGRFVLNYKANTSPIEAQWSSATQTVKPKFFSLNAQQCKYAKEQGEFPDASLRLLKDADLQVPLGQLQYMRNEIYARHGYAFQNKKWAITFSQYDWYMPCYLNVDARLTQIEKENVKRIKMVEPYAKDVDWGR